MFFFKIRVRQNPVVHHQFPHSTAIIFSFNSPKLGGILILRHTQCEFLESFRWSWHVNLEFWGSESLALLISNSQWNLPVLDFGFHAMLVLNPQCLIPRSPHQMQCAIFRASPTKRVAAMRATAAG